MVQSYGIISSSANRDYTFPENLTAAFVHGDGIGSLRCVKINIIDDYIVESDEVFTVFLSSSSYIQPFGLTSTNVTIHEDISDCKLTYCTVYHNKVGLI